LKKLLIELDIIEYNTYNKNTICKKVMSMKRIVYVIIFILIILSFSVVQKNKAKAFNVNVAKYKGTNIHGGAMVTFIDDDGTSQFLTEMKPILDSRNIKASLAIITDGVGMAGHITKQQLLDLQSEGFDVLSHSKTHEADIFKNNLRSIPDAAIEKEFRDSKQYLKDNGFKGYNTIVYPWGNFGSEASRFEKIAGKYYKYGLNASIAYTGSSMNRMYINRYPLQKTQDFNTILKPVIDKCIDENGWLILYTHAYNSSHFSSEYLAQTIDYIQQCKVPILTFSKAVKIKDITE